MSNQTIVELNHDYCPRDKDLLHWATSMQMYLTSGDKDHLPRGVVFKSIRHHSEAAKADDAEVMKCVVQAIRQELDFIIIHDLDLFNAAKAAIAAMQNKEN